MDTDTLLSRLALCAGFVALAVGITFAVRTPSGGYEVDLYRATPLGFWLGVGTALTVATVVALRSPSPQRTGAVATLLAGLAVLSVYALPVLRGYYFYGAGDSLSHLGWTRELAGGSLSAFDLLYPGVHSIALSYGVVGGVRFPVAITVAVLVVFPAVYLLTVPLCVELLTSDPYASRIGLLSALLVLPINNVSVHPVAHPTSQAILFAPFVVYVGLRFAVTRADDGAGGPSGTATVAALTALFAVAAAGIVLVHPQQALNAVGLFLAAVAVQAAVRWRRLDHPIATHRWLVLPTAILVVLFFAWTPRHPRATGATTSVLQSIFLQGATAGDAVGSRSVSLATLGGSLPELFVKLFLPSLLFILLAGGLVAWMLAGHDDDRRRDGVVAYVVASLVPLGVAFGVFFVSASGDQYFRYLGFIMVSVTLLGATAVVEGAARLREADRDLTAVLAPAVWFLLLAGLALVALHPSPYMYQPSAQVSENHLAGYANSFDHRLEDVRFTGVRSGPRRYVDATYGTDRARFGLEFPGYESAVPEPVFNDATYATYYDNDRYLGITNRDRAREVWLYQGLRYRAAGFRALETTPGVNRVRANQEFQLYYLDVDDSDSDESATVAEESRRAAEAGPGLLARGSLVTPGPGLGDGDGVTVGLPARRR
jgi:hypothetical protein